MTWGGLTSALGCFQPEGLECWTLADLQCWKLAVSVQRGQVGKFKVLDLLASAVLEHGEVGRGCRCPTSCTGQICFASKTCNWNPVQIGGSWAAFGQ